MYMGKITVITGPMASGKTARIIEIARKLNEAGHEVHFYKPKTDTRDTDVRSRNGQHEPCVTLDARDATALRNRHDGKRASVIILDEFQFFEDPAYIRTLNRLAIDGHGVIVSGLELTSELQPFGLMPAIMCYADEVVKVKGHCEMCGIDTPSIFTYADFQKTSHVAIEGGNHKYKSLCRKCHLNHK